MSRINRPDTLITELRDIKRRLRLLEAARMRGVAGAAPARFATSAAGAVEASVPLVPARPVDWPGTVSADWERLVVTWTAWNGTLVLQLAADAGSEGQARVLVDGAPVGEILPVTPATARYEMAVQQGEIAVEARRTAGPGQIRASGHITP